MSCGLGPVFTHLILYLAPMSSHSGPFCPLHLCSHRALAPAVPAATGALYSPLDMHPVHRHPSDLNSSRPPYTMYLVTPVIWGPLLRVFRGEAFREWPLVYHCQGSWLCFPHSRRRDLLPTRFPDTCLKQSSPDSLHTCTH